MKRAPGRLLLGAITGLAIGMVLELNIHPGIIGLAVGILAALLIGAVPGPLEGAAVGIIIGAAEYILLISNDLMTNPDANEKVGILSSAILIGSLVGAAMGALIGLVVSLMNKGNKAL